jgi:uncharacterized glyoxalase superfamily protein PhnB
MPDYDGRHYPTVSPYIYYEDLPAALDFLEAAFGCLERMRDVQPDGTLGHCELECGDSVLMFGSPPGFKNPAHTGQVTVGIYVHVDDVDAHYARAAAAGAQTQGEPVDQPYGVRSYGALDPEGHQWWFAQPLK